MTREIGDPLERAAVTGKIGGGSPPAPPTEDRGKAAKKSSVPDVQTSSTKEARKQHTIYLPPRLSKWLKLQAVEEDREISEIATDALEMYRKLHSS